MMEEDFYATLKLKNGEEIFAKVLPNDDNGNITLIITNPIVVSEIKTRGTVSGYKIEPWLKTTTEDMFILSMSDILLVSENNDIEMIEMYQKYLIKYSDKVKNKTSVVSREMGYISSVTEAKNLLEKIYKNS
jgi:hypothetical protein